MTENIDKFLQENNVVQIAICHENLEKIEELKKYINGFENIAVINQFIWNVNNKVMNSIHITNKNVSKGNAMIGMCEFLKIDLKDVIAIGDKGNDVSMIQAAGMGVAMQNATDDVKSVADFITNSNEEDGVAKVLEKILNEKSDK